MSIFTAEDLRRDALSYYRIPLNESWSLRTASKSDAARLVNATTKDPDTKTYDIFLSHSFLDRAVIAGLKARFERMGHATYVDWICDPQLNRANIGKATSEQLKMRMRKSRTLFYAFSSNAADSKWMPWELGFIDGEKDRCAVLRVEESGGGSFSYSGFEYLEIYPFVREADSTAGDRRLWVYRTHSSYVVFEEWRDSKSPQWRQS